jgi:uncharacterized FlgJ-related protein
MLYRYDKNKLLYTKVKYGELILKTVIITLVLILVYGVRNKMERARLEQLSEEEKLIIIDEYNEFSEEKLISKIKELNFRFPHIILAQAKLETGNFKSQSFVNGNNMFGMKQAKSRANTAQGTEFGHASYDTWKESLYDYALYYNAYLNKLRTESQYYSYLSQNYATDPEYVSKLKNIIQRENLKDKF